jgi:O-antigen/teichoic acid export membrane protein
MHPRTPPQTPEPERRTADRSLLAGANAGLHRRLTVNSISNVTGYAVSTALAFFITPFVVRTLGDSLYGLWVLLMSVVGYAGILELGVQPAVVKIVGQYKAAGNIGKLQQLLTASLVFFFFMGIFSGLMLAFVVPFFVQRFVDFSIVTHIRLVFILIAIDAFLMFLTYLVAGIVYGLQMYYAKNLLDIVAGVVNAGLLVLVLRQGGVLALTSVKLGVDLLCLIVLYMICSRAFPDLRFDIRIVSRDSLRELLTFGSKLFASATTTRIASQAPPIIISTALTSAWTAFFAIPARLVEMTRHVRWGLTTAFMPMFSELYGREELELMKRIYLRYTRYLFLWVLLIVVLLYVYGSSFIALWIGPEYAQRGHVVLLLLTSTVLVEGIQPLIWRFFIATGYLNALVKISVISSLLSVVGGVVLVKPLGINGVAASILASSAISQVLLVRHACRFLGISVLSFLLQVHVRPTMVGLIALFACWQLAGRVGADSYATMLLGGFTTGVLFLVLAGSVALTTGERIWVSNRMRTVLGWR